MSLHPDFECTVFIFKDEFDGPKLFALNSIADRLFKIQWTLFPSKYF